MAPFLTRVLLAGVLASGAAHAAATKAYDPPAVKYDDTAKTDAELLALIATLREAIGAQKLGPIDAALARDFTGLVCDDDPGKTCAPGAREARATDAALAPTARLRAALCCADMPKRDITPALEAETVLGQLGAALETESIGGHPDAPGAACMPAWPIFDRRAALKAAEAGDVEADALRTSQVELVLRAKPVADAAIVERIPAGRIVPLTSGAQESLPDGWSAIARPGGGTGFTDAIGLDELTPAGVCFAKRDGRWTIAFTVQRGG